MECNLPRTIRPGVLILGPQQLRALGPAEEDALRNAVDEMGKRSGKAQGLRGAITHWSALKGSGHRLFLAIGNKSVRGLLRVGERQLFIQRDVRRGGYDQISPTCVLDFYVHESCQRGGVGRTLFDAMLQHEDVQPHQLGYDRPSNKLIAFCAKHFGLKSYTPQANHFVVFDEYWNARRVPSRRSGTQQLSLLLQQQQQPPPVPQHGRGRPVSVQRLRDEILQANTPPAGILADGRTTTTLTRVSPPCTARRRRRLPPQRTMPGPGCSHRGAASWRAGLRTIFCGGSHAAAASAAAPSPDAPAVSRRLC